MLDASPNGLPPSIVVGRTLSSYFAGGVQNNRETITYTVYNEQANDESGVLLTTSLGNLLIVTITILGSGKGDESVSSGRFYFYAAMMAVVGLLFIIIAARYRYRDEPIPIGK